MDSEECRAAILANAKEVSDELVRVYRPHIEKARTTERKAQLHREFRADHERVMTVFVKLMAQLPPPPLIIEAGQDLTALQSHLASPAE